MLSKSLGGVGSEPGWSTGSISRSPAPVEYSLTALGLSIDPYLRALGEWGMQAYEAIQAG